MAAAGSPELVIPIRLDADKAVAGLAKVSTAGKQAGDQVAGGAMRRKTR